MENVYKERPLEERIKEFELLKKTYPTKIPIILDKHPNFPNLKSLTKSKYLFDQDIELRDFYNVIATKYLDLSMAKSDSFLELKLYESSNNKEIIILNEKTVLDIYEKYKDEDGFLYLKYSYEYKLNPDKKYDNIDKNEILKKFPDKVPIILEKSPLYPNNIQILKNKFLLPKPLKIEKALSMLIKHYFNVNELQNKDIVLYLTLTTNNIPFQNDEILEDIYNKYKSEDGFLYLYYHYIINNDSNKLTTNKNNNNNTEEYPSTFLAQHSNKIPIILEKDPNYPEIEEISQKKFLVYKTWYVFNCAKEIFSKYLNITNINDKNFYYFFRTKIDYMELDNNEMIINIYEKYKDEENFILHLYYSYEYKKQNDFILKSLEERKYEVSLLLKEKPNIVTIILENDPHFENNKKIVNNRIIASRKMNIFQLTNKLIENLELKTNIGNNSLQLMITVQSEDIFLSSHEIIEDIYNNYKSDDGVLYLYYSYKYLQEILLPIVEPKNKSKNSIEIEKNKNEADKYISEGKIPIIIEKYPLSIFEDYSQRYIIDDTSTMNDLINMLQKDLESVNNNENILFNLITDKNIDLRNEELKSIKYIYEQYKSEDDFLYLFYVEPSLLPFPKKVNEERTFKFKEIYSLEQRKIKYKELKNKHPDKILIRVEKDNSSNIDNDNNDEEKIGQILFFAPKDEVDSLKMKIWRKIGKPLFYINLLDKNKNIISNYSKIIDLYNNYKDNEDDFLYLYYKCSNPSFVDNNYNNDQNMTEAKKIFLLFKRIPFIFTPSPLYGNSNISTKVFLLYKSKLSTFKEIQTDKKYKYYIEYPKKMVDLNEKLVDFYLNNKNNENDFLYLTIEKE